MRAGAVVFLFFALQGVAEGPSRFHEDVTAVEAAALDATRALWINDTAAARKALDRLERLCRVVRPEERTVFGDSVVSADQAYHLMLSRAREFTGAGEGQPAFDAFIGVQMACRSCHGFAQSGGRWPQNRP